MRVIAGILVVLTLLVGAFFGYCYYGAQMEIIGVTTMVTPATEALGTYSQTWAQIQEGSFLGNSWRQADTSAPEAYEFLTLSVRMRNRGLFPMDWLVIEVTPQAADILQLPAERTPTLSARTTADFSTTLLTEAGGGTARTVTVTYYVLGSPFSATFEM